VRRVAPEITGRIVLDAPAGPFTLSARADRIDVLGDGVVIIDYKTGPLPSDVEVRDGKAPQLPLEAAIALRNGFATIAPTRVHALAYIRVTGGEPPGEYRTIKGKDLDAGGLAEQALEGLQRLIADFDRQETPYTALRRPAFAKAYRFDSFAQLARVKEWSGDAGEGDADA
jgi:ATP-dependent helicase/nuclease subunit B